MKKILLHFKLLIVTLIFSSNVTALDQNFNKAFGVWDRSNAFDNSKYPFFRGDAVSLKWSEIESIKGKYDWSQMKNTIDKKKIEKNRTPINFQLEKSGCPFLFFFVHYL